MTRGRRRGRARVAVVVMAIAAAVPSALAFGQSARPAPHVSLASQTAWVPANGAFDLRLDVVPPAADVDVAVVAYQRVASRSAFERTLDDEGLGSVIGVYSSPLASLSRDQSGHVAIHLAVQDPAKPRDPTALELPRDGVYPLRVELRDHSGAVVDGFTTHLLYQGANPPGPKLGVVLAVPVHAPIATQAGGTRRLDLGPVTAVAQALDGAPGVPVVVTPTAETLQSVAATNDAAAQAALADVRRGVDGRQVIAATYVPVSLATLVGNGLAGEATTQVVHGRDVSNEILRTPLDTTSWVAEDTVDDAALAELDRLGVRRVVVPESALAPLRMPLTLSRPFIVETRDGLTEEAAAGDDGLAAHFTAGGSSLLRAHQFLADLAVLYLDQPATPRGVVAVIPTEWQPDRTMLGEVLAGLSSSPWVQPMTLDDLFTNVSLATDQRNVPLVRRLLGAPRPAAGLDAVATEIRTLRRRLTGFADVVDAANPQRDGLPERVLDAESSEFRTAAARTAYLRGVRRDLDHELGDIQLPKGRTVTLTARAADIPLTFRNGTGYPVHAFVTLGSDKLEFPDRPGRPVDLVRANTTERFSVRARTSGAFPVRVTLTSPDGSFLIGQTHFTVRSTAASGVGIFLSGGAALFLLAWWAREIIRTHRGERVPRSLDAPEPV